MARQYGIEVDGVIAIDPLFLQNMLAVTGGVAMPDGSTLDGTNTAQTLLHDVYARITPQETDEYFAVAAQAAFDHITQNVDDFNRMSRRFPRLLSRACDVVECA